MTANKYLEKLKSEKDYWHAKVEAIPGDTIDANNPIYRMSVSASNRYAAAKTMMKLMMNDAHY